MGDPQKSSPGLSCSLHNLVLLSCRVRALQPWRRARPHRGLHGLCTTLAAQPEVMGASSGWVWDARRMLAVFRAPTAALARRPGSRVVSPTPCSEHLVQMWSHPLCLCTERCWDQQPRACPCPGTARGGATSPWGHRGTQISPVYSHLLKTKPVHSKHGKSAPLHPYPQHRPSPLRPLWELGGRNLSACSKLKSVALITCPGGRSNEVRPGDEQAHLPARAAGGVCVRACGRASCRRSLADWLRNPLQQMRGTGVA